MKRLIAWVRFHGWRNAYWREDWYETLCNHEPQSWIDDLLICDACGRVIAWYSRPTLTTGSSNVTLTVALEVVDRTT